MKSLKAQLSIAAVCIVLGLMLAYQFQNASSISKLFAQQQVDELQQQLKDAQTQKQDLEKSISDLEKKIEDYEKNASAIDGTTKNLKDELDRVRMFAGQTDVEGPGVKITLSPLDTSLNNNKGYMEVDESLLLVLVNELKACNAEAIAVNEQRIVASSTIRDVGTAYVQINGVRYRTDEQVVIWAIGDPGTLEGGLKTTMVQTFKDYFINLKIEQNQNIKIGKYNKVIDFKYAKPVKEGD